MRLRTRAKSFWVKGNSRTGTAPLMLASAMSSIALRKVSVTVASELLPLVLRCIWRRLEAACIQARCRLAARQAAWRCITQDRPFHRRRQGAQLVAFRPEAGAQLAQAAGLVLKAFRRRRGLLDQGRVLLSDLVHLRDGTRDLIYAARLLAAGAGN